MVLGNRHCPLSCPARVAGRVWCENVLRLGSDRSIWASGLSGRVISFAPAIYWIATRVVSYDLASIPCAAFLLDVPPVIGAAAATKCVCNRGQTAHKWCPRHGSRDRQSSNYDPRNGRPSETPTETSISSQPLTLGVTLRSWWHNTAPASGNARLRIRLPDVSGLVKHSSFPTEATAPDFAPVVLGATHRGRWRPGTSGARRRSPGAAGTSHRCHGPHSPPLHTAGRRTARRGQSRSATHSSRHRSGSPICETWSGTTPRCWWPVRGRAEIGRSGRLGGEGHRGRSMMMAPQQR